ncbi:MAG: hypothetical protein ABIF08_02120 [Nanoarchaeota archaeon]
MGNEGYILAALEKLHERPGGILFQNLWDFRSSEQEAIARFEGPEIVMLDYEPYFLSGSREIPRNYLAKIVDIKKLINWKTGKTKYRDRDDRRENTEIWKYLESLTIDPSGEYETSYVKILLATGDPNMSMSQELSEFVLNDPGVDLRKYVPEPAELAGCLPRGTILRGRERSTVFSLFINGNNVTGRSFGGILADKLYTCFTDMFEKSEIPEEISRANGHINPTRGSDSVLRSKTLFGED